LDTLQKEEEEKKRNRFPIIKGDNEKCGEDSFSNKQQTTQKISGRLNEVDTILTASMKNNTKTHQQNNESVNRFGIGI
jgi:hypothetical protein